MNKYKAQKSTVNGITFDSRKEARRYSELLLLQSAGVIRDLQMQVKYELIPAQYETYERYSIRGKRLQDGQRLVEKACEYRADFVYYEDGKLVVEDVKGFRTKDFIIKRKLMLHKYGIKIREV